MSEQSMNQHSQLNELEEGMFVFGVFIISPMGIIIAILILFILNQQRDEIKNKMSFKFAVLSVVASLLIYLFSILFCNDLLIPWQYNGKHQTFVSITDSISNFFYVSGKVLFYCSFTFVVLPLIEKNSSKICLKIWMVFACLTLFILVLIRVFIDITEQSVKEIGVTSKHNIYVTMIMGHEGKDQMALVAIIVLIVDILYFCILLYLFITQLKKTRLKNEKGIKGIVLISIACSIYWIVLLLFGGLSSLRWISYFDIISDDICLFLMFEG
eukprot:299972_1